MLSQKGVPVIIENGACNIPDDTELLIYSDAVPSSNLERERAKELGVPEMSYFEALGEISKGMRTIAVTGTHGKTTTTGMLAKILQACDKEPTAIIGSIVKDFGSNFLAGREDLLVVEACEYRDHVLKLTPEILIITNIELDHTDYFPDLTALQETFRKAAENVPAEGCIVTNPYDPAIAAILGNVKAPILDYTTQTVPALQQIGEFNRMNARAAKAAALAAFTHLRQGVALTQVNRALIDFKGSWRRFEYKGETPRGALVYDDYAHHPTAIEKTLEAVREQFPDKKIVVAFHPHLYSRTRSLMNEFGAALAKADEAIVAPIYAAREADDPAVTNAVVAEVSRRFGGNTIALDSFDLIRDKLLSYDDRHLIITMGAGDIYKVAEQIAGE